jgi:hypothetical protein
MGNVVAKYERKLAYRPQGEQEITMAVVVAASANLDQWRKGATHPKNCDGMAELCSL